MDVERIPASWIGWKFWEDYLIDPQGNRYSPDMIKTSFLTMELAHELRGSPLQVLTLKKELQRRLTMPPPQVIIRWNGEETIINAPLKTQKQK